MSATDELRRMLDERGVEYEQADGWWTSWETEGVYSFGGTVYCEDLGSGLEIRWHIITPEQAIAATLGAGTCRNVSDPPEGFLCSECGWGDFAEPSHLLTGSCYAGLAKGPRYCPNCGRKVVSE